MKKEELLKAIEKAILTEESATAIYYSHLKAISLRFPDQVFAQKFRATLEYLIEYNKKHKKAFEEMFEKVKREKRNDF